MSEFLPNATDKATNENVLGQLNYKFGNKLNSKLSYNPTNGFTGETIVQYEKMDGEKEIIGYFMSGSDNLEATITELHQVISNIRKDEIDVKNNEIIQLTKSGDSDLLRTELDKLVGQLGILSADILHTMIEGYIKLGDKARAKASARAFLGEAPNYKKEYPHQDISKYIAQAEEFIQNN